MTTSSPSTSLTSPLTQTTASSKTSGSDVIVAAASTSSETHTEEAHTDASSSDSFEASFGSTGFPPTVILRAQWFDIAAETIGLSNQALLKALVLDDTGETKTIAQVAEEEGVDPQLVIDAIF